MPDACAEIDTLLAQDFVERRPNEAAEHLEDMAPQEAADVVAVIDPRVLSNAFRTLSLAKALDILESTEPLAGGALLLHLAPARAGAVLEGLTEAKREEILERMSPADARELRVLATYPPDSAGRLRDPGIAVFRTTTPVADALARLKGVHRGRSLLNLFVVDDDGGLVGSVPLHEAVVADPGDSLLSLVHQPPLAVSPFASRSEIVETMRRYKLASLPVVGPQNTPIGVLRLNDLIEEVEKELSSDLLSMTGASKEESALSGPGFAVRKTPALAAGQLGHRFPGGRGCRILRRYDRSVHGARRPSSRCGRAVRQHWQPSARGGASGTRGAGNHPPAVAKSRLEGTIRGCAEWRPE